MEPASRQTWSANHVDQTGEAPIRYTLFAGRIGASTLAGYLRLVAEFAVWALVAPVPARFLSRVGKHRWSARYQRWWARMVARALGLQLDITGLEHVSEGEVYVVTPLHEGLVDVVALLHVPLPLRFVLRDEFLTWHSLGGYLRDTGQIAIQPENGTHAYRTTVREARNVLEQGASVVMCPQGTVLGIETDFQSGAFAVARALDRPILPVALTGTHRVWEFPFSPRFRRGVRASIRVLPPVTVEEIRAMDPNELRAEVQHRLKTEAVQDEMAPPRRFVPDWDGFAFEIDPTFSALAADVAAHRERGMRRRLEPWQPLDSFAGPRTMESS